MRFPPLNPELLVDAISASGYELTGQIVALGCLENRVFWLPTENQQDLVMKVYRPGRWQHGPEQLQVPHPSHGAPTSAFGSPLATRVSPGPAAE